MTSQNYTLGHLSNLVQMFIKDFEAITWTYPDTNTILYLFKITDKIFLPSPPTPHTYTFCC